MNTPTVMIGGRPGQIFEGEVAETFCFVPQECILGDGDDLHVAEIDYVRTGWDVRNMRFNDSAYGEHLFPDSHRPVSDLNSLPVRIFLNRIKMVRSA
jgi:hypothetical protein